MKLLCFLIGFGILGLTSLHAATPGGGTPAAKKIKLEPPSYWAPLKFKEGMPTEKTHREDEIRWFEKHLIPAISKSWQGEPWKDKALAFVRERLPRFQSYFKWEARPIPKITPKELSEAGCTDPWIRLLAAADYRNSTPDELWAAFDVIRDSGIDHALLRFAALPLLQNGSPLSGDRQSIALEMFTDWTADLGKSACYTKADDHLLFRHIRKLPAFRLDQSDFEIRLKQGTSLPQWILDTLAGEAAIDRAWESRGSGWANSVSEDGWKGFHKELEIARKHLITAWQARPDQPHAASLMIVVVMGDGAKRGENERLWFDRATAACFDYDSAYHRYRQALRPRWGGSHNTLLAFGLSCVDSKRFETNAPLNYFTILDDISEDLEDYTPVYQNPQVMPRIRALNAALLAAAKTPTDRADRRSHIVIDSWLMEDWALAYATLTAHQAENNKELTGAIMSRLGRLGTGYPRIFRETQLFGGPGGELARQANAKDRAGDPAAALKLWEAWAAQPATAAAPSGVKELVTLRTSAARLAVSYQSGKWTPLPVDRFVDWDRPFGTWDLKKPAKLIALGTSAEAFHCAVYPFAPGPRFEVKAKVLFTGRPTGSTPDIQLNLGYNGRSDCSALTIAAQLRTMGFFASLKANCTAYRVMEAVAVAPEVPATLEYHAIREGNQLTVKVNGKTIVEQEEITAGSPDWDQGWIAFGIRGLTRGSSAEFAGLEVRKLP